MADMRLSGDYTLHLDEQYHNQLDIEGFSLMLKDPSYCYKFYWLEAIVQLISEGIVETTFDAIIDEMIANAWYSVREFHIHLSGMQVDGQVRDGLERAVLLLSQLSSLPANASKIENFEKFAKNQYVLYELIHEKEGIHKLFESCYRDNLHSIWAGQELYRPGNTEVEFYKILEKNMHPVYDSARRQGYELWGR